jgi:peptide/nickel transport system permease protein
MSAFVIRRLLLMVPTVFGLITLVFFFLSFVPGDPIDLILGEMAAEQDRAALREALGLDEPVGKRYLGYLGRLVRGDLGQSISFAAKKPVSELIAQRFPYTAVLAITSVALALLIAIPLGVLAALRHGTWIDFGTMAVGLLGISMPGFWLGMMLIILFSFRLHLFPMPSEGGVLSIVLPAITLGVALAGILTRMTRSSMLDVIRSDYVRTARAKGLAPRKVIFRHALRNALLPVVTIAGLQLGALLTGAVITETIFSWPGLGQLTLQAIQSRDYPLVQGCVLVVALCYVLVNFLVDLTYAWIDPRIQLS